jgi:cobalt/nickel transport system permease protein
MHLEEFAEGNSVFHRLDPRVKFITLIPYIIVLALMQGIKYPALALTVSTLIIIITRIDMKKLLNRLVVVNIFILFLWLFLPFSHPGHEVFRVGPLTATREGFLFALSITLKANAIVLATIALLGTSEVFSLAHALVHLKFPRKLVYLFFFFYRYVSVLHDEYSRMRRAITIRAFHAKTNLHTYRTYAYLVGMLIVRSFDHSQRIYNAMLCRGFTGKFPVISHFELKRSDVILGILMSLVTIALGLASLQGEI